MSNICDVNRHTANEMEWFIHAGSRTNFKVSRPGLEPESARIDVHEENQRLLPKSLKPAWSPKPDENYYAD